MKLWFERGAWASKYGRRAAAQLRPEDVKRIAVIRHAALGDMVLVRPFLVEARKFFPNAEIVLSLVSNYMYGAPTDLVDTTHVLHGSDQKNVLMRKRIARAKELGNVDILFDLADTTRSRYLCLLTKAKLKVGFPYRWYLRNLLFDVAVPRSDFSFEAINMLDALMLMGANPQFPLNFAWKIPALGLNEGRTENQIVYFPFASADSKCWPADRFVKAISELSRKLPDHRHIVLGGIGAKESIEWFRASLVGIGNVEFQAALDFDSTLSFLNRSLLVVSNDTGIRNLAISLSVPTVGIFFSTVPYRYWPRYGNHSAIFCANGNLPAVEEVVTAVLNALHAE